MLTYMCVCVCVCKRASARAYTIMDQLLHTCERYYCLLVGLVA